MKSSMLAVALGAIVSSTEAQSLLDAIKSYPQLSNFTALYTLYPSIVPSVSNGTGKITILIPDDNAFAAYEKANNVSVAAVNYDDVVTQFQYQTMVGEQTAGSFSQPGGITVPTFLVDERYDNRTAGPALVSAAGGQAAGGQVLVVTGTARSSNKFLVRRSTSGLDVRSGLAADATIDAVDGTWDGGRFQIVDQLFTLPQPCSTTIRGQKMVALDLALNRTNLWDTLDHTPNVTCLGPNDAAFSSAGDPDSKLDVTALQKALLFHTIGQPLYSTFLEDGQTFTTVSNDTVRITVRGDDIYFNDARVVNANVLTNNGLMHVLDKVMSPNGTAPPASSTSAASTAASTGTSATGASSPSPTKSGSAGVVNAMVPGAAGLSGLVGLLLMML